MFISNVKKNKDEYDKTKHRIEIGTSISDLPTPKEKVNRNFKRSNSPIYSEDFKIDSLTSFDEETDPKYCPKKLEKLRALFRHRPKSVEKSRIQCNLLSKKTNITNLRNINRFIEVEKVAVNLGRLIS